MTFKSSKKCSNSRQWNSNFWNSCKMLHFAKYGKCFASFYSIRLYQQEKVLWTYFLPTERFWKLLILLHKAILSQSEIFIVFQAKIFQISYKILIKTEDNECILSYWDILSQKKLVLTHKNSHHTRLQKKWSTAF